MRKNARVAMTAKILKRAFSDASGKPVDELYQVGVHFDNNVYLVDVDRNDLESELRALSVYDAIARGRRVRSMPRRRPTLVAQMHARARSWAQEQGMEVGTRGAVSAEVLVAYAEAGGQNLVPEFVDDRAPLNPNSFSDTAD